MPILLTIIIIGVFLIFVGIKIINQYERGVILTLGKYTATLEPGIRYVIPIIQRMIRVDIRITTIDIPQQEVITKDNVPVGINAVVYFHVENPANAVLTIQDYTYAVSQYAQTALRDVIGNIDLDFLLTERQQIADQIKKIVDEETDNWGINVTAIKIQDIELPADMKRVMAKQAEAEREKRSLIIKAEGELKASVNIKEAAKILASQPGSMALRNLATIEKINPDPSKTVIFALPIEVMDGIKAISNLNKK